MLKIGIGQSSCGADLSKIKVHSKHSSVGQAVLGRAVHCLPQYFAKTSPMKLWSKECTCVPCSNSNLSTLDQL